MQYHRSIHTTLAGSMNNGNIINIDHPPQFPCWLKYNTFAQGRPHWSFFYEDPSLHFPEFQKDWLAWRPPNDLQWIEERESFTNRLEQELVDEKRDNAILKEQLNSLALECESNRILLATLQQRETL